MATKTKGGFTLGALTGVALVALLMLGSAPESSLGGGTALIWVQQNLGASLWFFATVSALFVFDLTRLKHHLFNHEGRHEHSALRDVVGLDQRLDVWAHLFVGIGVVWTAIGMRSALQTALGGGDLSGSANSVLKNLVDGGILLALTTTIVGGVGGYLMRLVKTVCVGAALQAFYEVLNQAGVRELIVATERIESQLKSLSHAEGPTSS